MDPEAPVEAFVAFMDASFRQSGACRTLTSRGSLPDVERDRLRAAVVEAHDLENDVLTRLRLLAPSRVVEAAQALHEAEHKLVTTAASAGTSSAPAASRPRSTTWFRSCSRQVMGKIVPDPMRSSVTSHNRPAARSSWRNAAFR